MNNYLASFTFEPSNYEGFTFTLILYILEISLTINQLQ